MDWPEVQAWRKAERKALIERRMALKAPERDAVRDRVLPEARRLLERAGRRAVGLYWPFRAEIDVRGFMRELDGAGFTLALPVVVEKAAPLAFWRYRPGDPLDRGVWNIPVPATPDPIEPEALIVPLVGFDPACYRLGYGGGYYDRTLAALEPRPLTIGIGYAFQALATIHPQPHDMPMDVIITEEGSRDRADTPELASPACLRHTLDPDDPGAKG